MVVVICRYSGVAVAVAGVYPTYAEHAQWYLMPVSGLAW